MRDIGLDSIAGVFFIKCFPTATETGTLERAHPPEIQSMLHDFEGVFQ